ncbi:hypothetical protein NBH08_20050, partial [Faecalicatena sp. BF-R-105]|nr:hypothetical protein [Faecalicatena sp. BF-R-105]
KTVSKSIRLVLKKIPEFVPIPRNKPGVKGLVSQCCLIFKVRAALSSELCYLITSSSICQQQIFSDAAELRSASAFLETACL